MLSLCSASDSGCFGVLQSRLKLIGNLPKDVQAPLSKMQLALSGQVSTELTPCNLTSVYQQCSTELSLSPNILTSVYQQCSTDFFLAVFLPLCTSRVAQNSLSPNILTSVYQQCCTDLFLPVFLPLCICRVAQSSLPVLSAMSLSVYSYLCVSAVLRRILSLYCQQCLSPSTLTSLNSYLCVSAVLHRVFSPCILITSSVAQNSLSLCTVSRVAQHSPSQYLSLIHISEPTRLA